MNTKIAVYGILKQGFSLDLIRYGGKFLGEDEVNGRLYHIGGGVGLRLDEHPVPQHVRAKVEVFEIPETLFGWLDEIEGVEHGVYTRKLIKTINGVESWIYEHSYYEDEPGAYGHRLKVIEDGMYKGGY